MPRIPPKSTNSTEQPSAAPHRAKASDKTGNVGTRAVAASVAESPALPSSADSSTPKTKLVQRDTTGVAEQALSAKQIKATSKLCESALKKKDTKRLAQLCMKHPWLIAKYPQVLELKERWMLGVEGSMIFKFCSTPKGWPALEQALKVKGEGAMLESGGITGCTPLSFLISEPTQAIPVHILEGVPDEVFLEKSYGWTHLHTLAKAGQREACQFLMKRLGEQPFHEPNSDNKTPLELLAEFKTTALERSEKTAPLKPHHSAEKSHKSHTAAGLDLAIAAPAKSASTAIEQDVQDRLNLDSTVALGSAGFEEKARRLVNKLETVGVNATFNYFKNETKDHFYSLGDENASLMLMHRLVSLGTPHIQLRINLADKANGNKPDAPQPLAEMKAVAMAKLSYLLAGSSFDQAKGLPQKVVMGQSVVNILGFDEEDSVSPALEMGFGDQPKGANGPKNYMVLKPFRFVREDSQKLTSDIDTRMKDTVMLDLPPNSFPHDHSPQKRADTTSLASETAWIENAYHATGATPQGAEGMAKISRLCREGKVHNSVIYGVHHQHVASDAGTLMEHWVQALEQRGQPALLLVNGSRIPPKAKTYFEDAQIPTFTPDQGDLDAKLAEFIGQGRTGLVILPDLPKPVFEHVIRSSDLPALVEGANTTSHLLETGHAYLSVLPDGYTPVPYEMGYPLEALKAEAFSYKLKISPKAAEKLDKLKGMVERGEFTEAATYLRSKESNSLTKEMRYLSAPANAKDDQGRKKITVMGLLEKGSQRGLGKLETAALISVLDASPEALASYIDDSLNPESATTHHRQLQQMHITQPFNDSVLQALHIFAEQHAINLDDDSSD